MYRLRKLLIATVFALLTGLLVACGDGDDNASNNTASNNGANAANCDGFAEATTTLDGSDKPLLQAVFDYPSNWETFQYSANETAGGLYVSLVSNEIPMYDLQYSEVRSPASFEEVNSGEELETHTRTLSFKGQELNVWVNTDPEFESYGYSDLIAEYEYQNSDGQTEFLFMQMHLKKRPDGPRGHCHPQAVDVLESNFFSLKPNPDTSLPL